VYCVFTFETIAREPTLRKALPASIGLQTAGISALRVHRCRPEVKAFSYCAKMCKNVHKLVAFVGVIAVTAVLECCCEAQPSEGRPMLLLMPWYRPYS